MDDDIIYRYAEILQRIYDNQTAGEYTFNGVLAEFAQELIMRVWKNDSRGTSPTQ